MRLSLPKAIRHPVIWIVLLGWLLIPGDTQAATWEIVTAHGRQYIPLRCLKDFYGLESADSDEPNQVRLRNKKVVVDFRADTRECAINGVRIWLSFPALSTDSGWLISRMDVAKTIEPAVRPAIIKGLSSVTTVVLDPGHGGHDGGAVSRYGYEKAFALDIARRVKKRLVEGGYQVILTRSNDTFIPLHERPAMANGVPNCIFVSIHFNASQQGDAASGIEVFSIAPRGAPSTNDNYITWASLREEPGHNLDMASFALGRAVHTALMGYLHDVDRGLKRARFAVIRTARVPAILVECGFLTNREEVGKIATDAHREEIARAIAEGISDYKLLAELHKNPRTLADYNRVIDTKITLREDHEAGVNNEMENPAPNLKSIPAAPTEIGSLSTQGVPAIEGVALLPFSTDSFPFVRKKDRLNYVTP